jgi:thioredoxin-dependent peroxiredoxin
MLSPGDPAPDFSLAADDGRTVSLSGLRGSPVVVYFYPKDDTPGCTAQACSLRDGYGDFEAANAVVLGISPDGVASHRRFKDKFGLPFPLLADEDHQVAEAYGVWAEKTRGGRTYMGIKRSAFVIDENGTLVDVVYGIKPDDTTPRALAALAG